MAELQTNAVTPFEAMSAILEGYARAGELEAADIEVLYDLMTARHAATMVLARVARPP